ncbi:hypothetical protein BBI01_03650 [Chryseobacterium artocarpi]|uniref:DAC domain-containing protein n=1 Tax=Chryseobacterium artocarpi TaxID=1414727 RepID=A0A1B9A182_9FLAO|nr:hypothetical protein [Chryseobacterium artocarpi]OCA77554.1 hypothetical protein BBI01_03650 [Chryseobacterium artocarpi]
MGKSISLKQVILDQATSLLKAEGMDCLITQDGIVSLVNQLVNYREEGKNLFPKIYIVDDIDLVLSVLPTSQYCFIGEGNKTKETMQRALKKCAPLTDSDWSIYIQRTDTHFKYGVFRAGVSLLSVEIEDLLIKEGSDEIKVILLHQISDKLIEIKSVANEPLVISFGGSDEPHQSPTQNQLDFVDSIVKNVKKELKEQTFTYYKKIFNEILKKGHGSLACVISHKKKIIPKKLLDGIILEARINIPEIIEELRNKNDLTANSKLNGLFTIIIGMMESDGITIFTNSGEIAAYNVFIKHPNSIAKTNTSGGARSRTFLALNSLVGNGLEATYIQSQDGKIEIKKK